MSVNNRRQDSWRHAQKRRRDRLQAEGKVLVRIWCTPLEAARLKQLLRQWRREARLKALLALAATPGERR